MGKAIAALLLALFVTAVPARAVDQAMFNAVASQIPVPQPQKYDERAVLAALLARPDMAAQFEADGRAALSDPQLKSLMVAKWRGRAAAYATTQVNHPGLDYSKTYHDWKDVLGPEGTAYVRQRLLTMSKSDSDDLIKYLGLLDRKLQDNNYKIDNSMFSIANKIVGGILDEYKKDLAAYLAVPETQAARAAEPSVEAQLSREIAQRQAQAVAAAEPAHPSAPPAQTETPAKPPVRPKTPPPAPPPIKQQPLAPPAAPASPAQTQPVQTVANGSTGALEQAKQTQQAGANGGQVIDGAADHGGAADVVAGSPDGGTISAPTLAPAGPVTGSDSSSAAAPPSPVDSLDAQIAQASKSNQKPYSTKLELIGAGAGALLGGLLGFLLGGPIGALIGALAGAAAGFGGGYLLAEKS